MATLYERVTQLAAIFSAEKRAKSKVAGRALRIRADYFFLFYNMSCAPV
jgi:hypothetical protein